MPSPGEKLDELYIWNEVQQLFDRLNSGTRNPEVLTLGQFQKLGKVPWGNPNVIKADFDILFKNALRRASFMSEQGSPGNAMDLYVFMDALEMLTFKLYPACKPTAPGSDNPPAMTFYEALRQTLDIINKYFEA